MRLCTPGIVTQKLLSQVLEVYRDRPVWILNGPSLTGHGYEVVSGPLTVGDMLSSEKR